ncbi:hypothetical protein ACHAWF_013115 [Thalassiosira exigua]
MPKRPPPPSRSNRGEGVLAPNSGQAEAPPVPRKYGLRCAVREGHGRPIYCAAFSRHVHQGGTAVLATCGGPFATVYEVDPSPSSAAPTEEKGEGGGDLAVRQVYRDADDEETFYACAFGGRGAGSPADFVPLGVVDEEGVVTIGESRGRSQKRRKRQRVETLFLPGSDAHDGPPLLCLGGTRGVIKVIDTVRRCLAGTLSGHGNDVTDLKFSPANEWLLLSASKDESVRLWNLRGGVNVAVFAGHNGHRGQVLSVSWHADGTRFASCGMDNAVKLWRVFDGDRDTSGKGGGRVEAVLRRSFRPCPIHPSDASPVDPNGEHEAGGARRTRAFDTVLQQFPYFSTNKAHANYVDCVQFAGDLILSKSVNNKVVLWKPVFTKEEEDRGTIYSTHKVPSSILFLREFKLEHCNSWYIRFDSPSPHHRLLALGNQVGDVKVWTIGEDGDDDSGCDPNQKYFCNLSTSGSFTGTMASNDPCTVRMVVFNPHGSHLLAVRDDSTVWMWDAIFHKK